MVFISMVNEFTSEFNKTTQITVKVVLSLILLASISVLVGIVFNGAPNVNFG